MRSTGIRLGFTLIELLVVVAIISLLSSIVMASLNTGRDKSRDAAIKSNLLSARTSAGLYQGEYNTTSQICTNSARMHYLAPHVEAAERAYNGLVTAYNDTVASTWNTAQCHDDQFGNWVAWVPLRSSTASAPRAWCVDATGASRLSTVILQGGIMTCPPQP
jgi:prepilin-type N-terminal cleavage/methylation domain-containing protein